LISVLGGSGSSKVSRGQKGLAPAIRTPDGSGYRLYLECVFDELSTEVKVLFDRRDPSSALWPKRATFDELLAILNAQELAGIWGESTACGRPCCRRPSTSASISPKVRH
jgi:hypothetical protein